LKIDLLRVKEHGTIAEIREDVVRITGLTNCMNGQLLRLGPASQGVVVGFDPDYVLALVVKQGGALKPGDEVTTTLDEFRVPVGKRFVGRQVNALAEPTDGMGPIKEDAMYPIFGTAPAVLDRVPLAEVLQTGTKIVDMLKPVGKGQRMLIIGDRMTGKTTVGLDAIMNQQGKHVYCIYCSIGKPESTVAKAVDLFTQRDVWEYGILVAATAANSMGQQYLAPYVAASLGEYFMREQGADVLVIFDDFTKHAWAYRQISLLLDRAPGRDAYPGDIFYIHSQLVERAGKLKPELGGGSMTHMPIVETQQGDVAGYIPSNSISMTDGQIYLSATLFGEGFKPAIDMGLSVSRIGNRVQWPAMKRSTGMLQLEFVRFKELEKLTRIKAGVSHDVDRRLRKGRVLEEILKQEPNAPTPMEEQVILLYALQQGFLEDAEPADVRSRLEKLMLRLRQNRPALIEDLIAHQVLSDAIREGLNDELARFAHPAA